MEQTADALDQLMDSAIAGETLDDGSEETQLKVVHLIIQHGIEEAYCPPGTPKSQCITKSLAAIEAICDKNPLLLNRQVRDRETVIYKWILSSLIELLALNEENVQKAVKATLMTVIHLITTKLKLFTYKRDIRAYFMSKFDSCLTNLFKPDVPENLLSNLSICSNLFSVLTDLEVRKKMMLDASFDQRFEAGARKIDYVITNMDLQGHRHQVDTIKSHMIINVLNYSTIDETLSYSRSKFALTFFRHALQNTSVASQPLVRTNVSLALLKIFKVCLIHNHTSAFVSGLQFDSVKDIVTKIPGDSILPKVLGFLSFALDPTDLSKNTQNVHVPFQDKLMENTRLHIISLVLSESEASMVQALPFKIDGSISLEQWLKSVKQNKGMLSRTEKYALINSIGEYACMISRTYDTTLNQCSTCSYTSITGPTIDVSRSDLEKVSEAKAIHNILMREVVPQGDDILDMAALISLQKIFVHFQPPRLTNSCVTFNYIKQCMGSKNRDVRLLAVRLIIPYVICRQNQYEANTNFIIKAVNCFDLDLHQHLAESTIMIWGQLAMATEGSGLHPILLKLVDFLASSNSFRSSMAFHELEMTAMAKKQSPWQLLSLVLPSLSLTIAQKLSTKPAMAQRISDLVGVPIPTIFSRYQDDIVPFLLTYYKRDLISEIAAASGKTKLDVVLANRAKIFAFLLTQLRDPTDATIHGILVNACPEFTPIGLEELCSPSIPIVWELLKLHKIPGKSDELIKKSILFILRLGTSEKNDDEIFKTFFQRNTLGVAKLFSDAIRGTKGNQTYDQKLKSFRGIELLVQLSTTYGSYIVSALPQIYTCLQSSLEIPLLREATLRCWRTLCSNLAEEHLVSLLDQTVASVIQKLPTFDTRCKLESKKLISVFFEKSEEFRAKHIFTFFSLAEQDDFAEMFSRVMNLFNHEKLGSLLHDITRRCKHDNKYVVKQALVDLSRFLKKHSTEFYSTFLYRPIYGPLMSTLIASLLDILSKFNSDDEVCIQCSRCLGEIGALDPTKFEIGRKKGQLVIASNFEDQKEKIRFMITFLNQHLVPSFWASDDPTKQVFLAYAMQEFLKYCGLDATRFDFATANVSSPEALLWNQFSDISKSTLTPLVSSKYIASVSNYTKLNYPIFNAAIEHEKWVRQLTMDLLKRGSDQPFVGEIFTTCSSLVKEQDISLCYFLLPYAALNSVVMVDNEEELHNLRSEIMAVLSSDTSNVNHLAFQSLKLAYETVFNLMDYFSRWIFSRKQLLKRRGFKGQDHGIQKVTQLLDSIPQHLLAQRSLQASSYERAALYLEQCHRHNELGSFGDSFYGTLQSMYASIGDYDALDGVLKKFSTKSLEDRITELEYSDNWKMAQNCLEALGEDKSAEYAVNDGETRLLKSLFDHNLYDQTLGKLEALVTLDSSPLKRDWLSIGLEASVLAGKTRYLEKWLSNLDSNHDLADSANLVYYHMGKALLAAKGDQCELLKAAIENVYLKLGENLGLQKPTSLKRHRSDLVLLHSIADLETILTCKSPAFSNLKELMDSRISHVGNDFKSNWVLTSVRRSADAALGSKLNVADISETWVQSSKSARKNNRLDLATSSIMHAIQMKNDNTDLEYAKLLWAQGDHTRALAFIEEMRSNTEDVSVRERASFQLKYTKWLDYSNNSSSIKIVEEYNAAIKIDPSWEKPHYALGRYYNKLLDISSKLGSEKIDHKALSGELERKTIQHYLKALSCGTKYLYEALPKVITVWLDFAESIDHMPDNVPDSLQSTSLAERRKNLATILEDIKKSTERLPVYYWYTVFSQLLSRLLHPHKNTSLQIIVIAQMVVLEYPSHSLWSILAQYKSTQKDRERKAKKIVEMFVSGSSHGDALPNAKIFEKSKKLFTSLISVSKKKVPKRGILSLSNDFEFDHSSTPSPLVVPVKTNFNITLPASVQAIKNHNPFPNTSRVTIHKFENRVDVLSSMQQPRHLYLRGSNGLLYGILCKPNDDLRKDAKLMEFTTMIDHLLKKSYEAEQRKLHINTYAVIPLNEVYGIIEWVDNSRTMRDIIKTHYSNINIALDITAIRKVLDLDCDVPTKAEMFRDQIMTMYPPVLYQWFIENFPDPSSWYDARNNYTRTTAVMSMVGYMLGLGDRHGENLLLNENNGGLLHVDFDCLFEKGLELAVPERVPFRLTPNMVDAFGVTGVEGTFRRSCEVTLRLIRGNETTLMNILESFLHDPIMDWSHKRKNRNTPQGALSTIRRKIRGILDKEGLPMSVPGQAEFLIHQATSLENLCQMYIGWMAFW